SKNSQACGSARCWAAKYSLTPGQWRLIAPPSGKVMITSPTAQGLASITVRGAFTRGCLAGASVRALNRGRAKCRAAAVVSPSSHCRIPRQNFRRAARLESTSGGAGMPAFPARQYRPRFSFRYAFARGRLPGSFPMQRHPPPHGPGLVLFALAVGGFAIGITEFATMSLLPYFAAGLDIDAPTAGHVISAYALGVVIGAPLIAVVGARLARRTMLVLLMGGFAAANGLSALAPSYGWMLLFRFLSGLPHGAYFGYAALVATSLVPPERRTQAVGRIFLGLTFATVVGVPLANWLGQALGWRWSFVLVAASGVTTALLIWRYAPACPADPRASPLRELGALRRGQVWLTLLTGAIGFGGLFAVYTYLADLLLRVTHTEPHVVPLVLSVMGLGMTLGNLLVPRLADRALMPT